MWKCSETGQEIVPDVVTQFVWLLWLEWSVLFATMFLVSLLEATQTQIARHVCGMCVADTSLHWRRDVGHVMKIAVATFSSHFHHTFIAFSSCFSPHV